MSNETRMFLELWNAVRDNIPKNATEGVIASWLTSFEDYGIDPVTELVDLLGEEKALASVYGEMYSVDDEEDEIEDGF